MKNHILISQGHTSTIRSYKRKISCLFGWKFKYCRRRSLFQCRKGHLRSSQGKPYCIKTFKPNIWISLWYFWRQNSKNKRQKSVTWQMCHFAENSHLVKNVIRPKKRHFTINFLLYELTKYRKRSEFHTQFSVLEK